MAKTKLCSEDEGNLIEKMKAFANLLEDFGIEGDVTLTFYPSGTISGTFFTDEHTELKLLIENDGDKKTVEYAYV